MRMHAPPRCRGPEQSGPALASCNLGILYYNEGQYERAVAFFERFFEVARTLPDRRAVDAARVNLGVARGAVRMKVRAVQTVHVASQK
jgi:tetratricopeptide (TPR) repeat protein